jgi:hypothetical protein
VIKIAVCFFQCLNTQTNTVRDMFYV